MISVNLIPLRRQAARTRRVRVRFWAGVVGAYLGVATLGTLGARLVAQANDGVLARRLESVGLDRQKSEQASVAVRADLQQARRKLEIAQAVRPQPDWSVLLAAVAANVADDIVLRSVRLQDLAEPSAAVPGQPVPPRPPTADGKTPAGGHYMLLTGLGRTQTAVSQLALQLEQIGVFDKVKLVETQREPFLDGEAIGFRIECLIAAGEEVSSP